MGRVFNFIVFVTLSFSHASAQAPRPKPAAPTAQSFLTAGQKALDAGRYSEALQKGSAVVAKYPKRYEGHRLVARAAFLLDQPDRAEAAYRQALQLAPTAAKPAIQTALREVPSLRQALRHLATSRTLKASGDAAGAARAQENAYRLLPTRFAFGLAAADLFETAGLLEDAQRLLEDVNARKPAPPAPARIAARIEGLQTRIEAARQQAAEERARKEAEERKAETDRKAEEQRRAEEAERRAADAERKRIEAERLAEEERQRAERARLNREEIARLTNILNEQRADVNAAESDVRRAADRISESESIVRRIDNEADDARSRRNRARNEVDDWEDKVKNAKDGIERDFNRIQLRSAEAKLRDAQDILNQIAGRLSEAKSRRDQAQRDADAARRRLDEANTNVRDTESAITRIASGG